jgi:ketosteroid isomerase-like protein
MRLDLSRGDTVATRGLVAGTLALIRPDVVYLRAGIPAIYGRDAVRVMLSAARPPMPSGASFAWQPLGGELSADGRSGYTYGLAVYAQGETQPSVRVDRYIAYWQRDPRQPWRIAAYSEVNGTAVEVSLTPEQIAPPVQSSSGKLAQLLTRLRSTDSAFSDLADRSGVAEAFAEYVAQDGAVFAGPELVVGPKAVRELFDAQAGSSLTWTPLFAGGALSEDLGFTVGNYVSTGRGPSGAAVQRFGKYITVWKRQRDGSWKFMIDGGSPNPARQR